MKNNLITGTVVPASLLTLLISACGGGGSNPAPGTPGFGGATLTGVAAKGIVKAGQVTAEELGANGSVIAVVGSATTGEDGSYTLTIGGSYAGGPLRVTISTDTNTQIKCDVLNGCGNRDDGITDTQNPSTIDFGEWYKPGTLSMTALVAGAQSGDKIDVAVTPYTHLAAVSAMSRSTLDASAINEANSMVSNLVGGINILATQPVDITNTSAVNGAGGTQTTYAAMNAAIATLADASSGHPDLMASLSTLSTSFADDEIDADDQGANPNYSLKEIFDNTNTVLTGVGATDSSGALSAMQNEIDNAVGGKVQPSSNPQYVNRLAMIKAFVGDLRTWGHVIEQETQDKANAFGNELSFAGDAANYSAQFILGPAFKDTMTALQMNFEGVNTATDLTQYSGLGFTAGTIANNNGTITISGGKVGDASVNIAVKTVADGTTVNSAITLGVTHADITSSAAELHITDGTIALELKTPYTVDWTAIKNGTAVPPEVARMVINFNGSFRQSLDQNGAPLPAVVTFAGSQRMEYVNMQNVQNGGGELWMTPKQVTENGSITTSTGHVLRGEFTFNIRNANAFSPVGYSVPVGTSKLNLVQWTYSDNGNTFNYSSPNESYTMHWIPATTLQNAQVDMTRTYYGYTWTETLYVYNSNITTLRDFVTSNYSPLYSYVAYGSTIFVNQPEGTYTVNLSTSDLTQDGSAAGTMLYPAFTLENSSHWLDGYGTAMIALKLDQLPEATISLAFNRTGFTTSTGEFRIAYGNRSVVVDMEFGASSATGSVTITNQDNVKIVLQPNAEKTAGIVTYNGQSYATVEPLSNGLTKISYTDGTFETW